MIPQNVERFRQEHQKTRVSSSYNGWAHFAFTTLSCWIVIGFCLWKVNQPSILELWVVPVTFLYANLVEYLGHKGPMHNRRKPIEIIYDRHAGEHHQYFTHDAMEAHSTRDFAMVLFPPEMIFFFVGICGFPLAVALHHWVSPNVGFLYFATAMAYFLNYEWLHFAYHMPTTSWVYRVPGMKRLRSLHMTHHNPRLMRHHNFNITYPICDHLFKTYYRE